MAKNCTYTIDGVSYSENEFKAHLLNGALDRYSNEGLVSVKGLSVEKKKPTRQDITRGLNELLKGKEKVALAAETNPNIRRTFEKLGIKEGDTIQDVVDRLIEEGDEYSDILKAIKADENFKNLQAEFINDKEGGENNEAGLYYPTENRLQIWNKDNVKYTIAHELMHWFTLDSATAEQLKDTQSYKALDDLYNYIAAKKGKPVAGLATMESYGLTNNKEFMAELLINPTFRNYVSDVYAQNKDDIFKTSKDIRDSKAGSILDLIKNFFTDLFNTIIGKDKSIPFDEKQSVVDNAVNLATNLFFGGQNITKDQQLSGEGARVLGIGSQQAAALALPSQFNPEEVNPIINQYVKGLFDRGATEEDIKGGLTDFGLTEEEAQKFIDDNKPPSPPKEEKKEEKSSFENKPKSILNRIYESKNIPKYVKERFETEGLKYNPQSHEVARKMAKNIIDEFGTEDAISMAESGRFNGDVNSMIFAESIDQTFEREQSATTSNTKQKYAEQWADYVLRYDETARQKGRFISAIYDFYKKSPLGVIIAEKARRDETFKDWFKIRNKDYKEVFEAIKDEPEFKEFLSQQVESKLKEERATTRQKRRKKIEDIFDAAKIKKDGLNSSLIPPPIWNAAMEVMKQAALAGESLVSVIEAGINHIKENHKEAFNEEEIRNQWKEQFKGIDTVGKPAIDEKTIQQKILDRFRKKLSGLSDKQKEDVIRRSFKTLVENGALEYDEFKKIVADVMGLGELSEEEIKKINQYVKDINSVQDAANKVVSERSKKSLEEFEKVSKKAERAATELGNIVNNKTNVLQRVRSIIQLNTLGLVSLIKNPFYNIFYQGLVRFPRAVIQTALDQSIYGTSLLGNKLFGTKIIKPDTNIFLAQKGYFKKAGTGTNESVRQVFTGLTNMDYFQKEVKTSQIKPLQAWRDIWSWKKGDKFLSNSQVADKLIQGTVGIPAEAVARMLNIGDKPFRFAAEGAIAETIAAQEFGLKSGLDKDIFVRFPKEEAKRLYLKKGLSEEDATQKAEAIEKRIVNEGEQAVFQQKNIITEGLNGLGAMMDNFSEDKPIAKTALKVGKVLGTLNAPFLRTPLNIFWELFNLAAPEVALTQSAVYGFLASKAKYNGENAKAAEYLQQSKKWMAHGATGYTLLATTAYFASIGAISGADDDDPEKERKGKKTYQRPRSLNVSKVMRAFFGGDTEDENNDLLVDLSWFGASGVILNMQANRYESMTKDERDNAGYLADMMERMNASAVEGLENSIFSGTIAGINAFRQGGRWTNMWLMNQMNVGTNFFQPATFAQFSRATLPYNYTIKDDSFADEVRNNFAARSLLFRAFSGMPPSDITIWGDKAMRNNDGVKGVMFNMLGFDQYNKDAFAEPIFQDFKKTGNSSFFPTAVRGSMTVDGQDMKMNAEQERQFKTLVGQSRKSLVAPFVNNSATIESKDEEINDKKYSDLTESQKVKALNVLYKKGYEIGKDQFKELHPEFQTQKEKEEEE